MAANISARKMVATMCVAMLLVQSSLGYLPELGGGAGGLACPSSENDCRDKCKVKCDSESVKMCETLCTLPVAPVGSTCVNQVLIACFAGCLSSCQIPKS